MAITDPRMTRKRRRALVAAACLGAALALPAAAQANHPVLVEGNCGAPDTVTPGSCGDYDSDGRVGAAEDSDSPDRVFGTINGALGNTDLGATINATRANMNGRVLVVASGQYPESVRIAGTPSIPNVGNVTLVAAPGVEANVDAVVQGEAGNAERQAQPGIIVDTPSSSRVTIRNIISRNWTDGITVRGSSRVTIDESTVENNTDYGILGNTLTRLTVRDTQINANGFRVNPMAASNAADPGAGLEIRSRARASIRGGTVSDNADAGVENATTGATRRSRSARRTAARRLNISHVQFFNNNPGIKGPFTRQK